MLLLLTRIKGAIFPAFLLLIVVAYGFFPALKRQLSSPSLFKLLSPRVWWSEIFASGFPALLDGADKQWASVKKQLLANANGNILEVGSGAGHTIAYYNPEKVTKIVGIEPFVELHPLTRASIQRAKLTDKYDLVGASIEDAHILAEHGVTPGSMDTIVCVQVLCSIPNPKEVIAEMYKYLKPGGQLILFEHIRSRDFITQSLQNLWTYSCWHVLTGCNLNRPSDEWLQQAGEWSFIELNPGPGESDGEIIPHSIGRLVKACR